MDANTSRNPIFITSTKIDESFVVQYDSGDIIGYNFQTEHKGFTGTCPDSGTSCPSKAESTTVKGVSYSKLGLAYFLTNDTVGILSAFNRSIPLDQLGSIYFIPESTYSNMILVAGETKLSFYNALYSNSVFYTLNEVNPSFDSFRVQMSSKLITKDIAMHSRVS